MIIKNPITMPDVRRFVRYNPVSSRREKVLNAYIIGSVAKGTANENSDIDIAVIIDKKPKLSALKLTEQYHAKFTSDQQKPRHEGRLVDIQFFYPEDQELAKYKKIKIS